MAIQLLSNLGKRGVDHQLFTMQVDIDDTAFLSKYFDVVEFEPIFTAGKNSFSFNGSSLLKDGAEIKVQCIDSNGNILYLDYPKSSTQYTDVARFVVAIHIYNETYNGAGKIALVGITTKNEIVRWIGNITIDKTLQNISKTRFQTKPIIEARSLLYNVISNDVAQTVNKVINFNGTCYSNAIIPQKDTIRKSINPKKSGVDYRLTFIPNNSDDVLPHLYPTKSFNTQMEGKTIDIETQLIQTPFSYKEMQSYNTETFKIKKVLNSTTVQLDRAFFITAGKDQVVTNINIANFNVSYKWVSYNTASYDYNKYTDPGGNVTYQKESYAEVTYRNLGTFTGLVSRHKVYRKSMLYPGDFQLFIDEPIGATNLLVDPITPNKSYNLIGEFYNQWHINKYWCTSSNSIELLHSVFPNINSMTIKNVEGNFNTVDGTSYVICKMAAPEGKDNDHIYRPYNLKEYNELYGESYSSNFINLKSGSLYVLSLDLIVEKSPEDFSSKLEFYFTSSTNTIEKEKTYIPTYGWKLGEISILDKTDLKIFSDKQYIYFIPSDDYYGTLVIVPYHCNPTLSELTIGEYGDYGYSPDSFSTRVPFKINVANEPWQIKSELFDINSNLIYSNLQTVQSFDEHGASLFVFIGQSNYDPEHTSFVSGSLTVSQSFFLPNIPGCPGGKFLLGWSPPQHSPPQDGEGGICYTNIRDVEVVPVENDYEGTRDYLNVITTNGEGKSIAVQYGENRGRKIFVDLNGSKNVIV